MWNWVAKLHELYQAGKPFALMTVTHSRGSTPRESGAKMIVLPDGKIFGTIGGGQLEHEATEAAMKSIVDSRSRSVAYPLCAAVKQCCGGSVEVFIEVMNREPQLYLFGAGHVGQAVCRTLVGTPFRVSLVDERKEFLNSPEIPAETTRIQDPWRDFVGAAEWTESATYAVIMTHTHDLDFDILDAVLKKHARYIGVVGSASKWATFKKRLLEAGHPAQLVDGVRCPIGVDTGGKAPQEVAISLAAQLLAVHYDRPQK